MTLAQIADWATIAGLLATMWVLWATMNLRKTFLYRARLPELRSQLEKLSKDLLKASQSDDSNDAHSICSKIHAALESTQNKLRKSDRPRVSKMIDTMNTAINVGKFTTEEIKPIYSELTGITEMLKHVEKDVSWRP